MFQSSHKHGIDGISTSSNLFRLNSSTSNILINDKFYNKNLNNGDINLINNLNEYDNNLNLNRNNEIIDLRSSSTSFLKDDLPTSIPSTPKTSVNRLRKSGLRKYSVEKISYERNSFLLWIVTPLAASFSVAIIIAALAGPQWLLTEEKMQNSNYNGTANYNVKDDGVYTTKYTKSSLWILCTAQGTSYHCNTIDYFPKEEYSPDPNDSTMAIPYAITRAAPFFFLSGLVLIISYILLILAMCSHQHGIYYFTSGILFIIAGLLMLIGLIMYISIFKADVGSKLRPKSTFQPALFTFQYGQSFLLYVLGFIITEFVGILNVFLYIRLHHTGYEKPAPYFGYCKTSAIGNINIKKFAQSNKEKSDFGCKKHSTPCFSSAEEKRYYFEKPLLKCDIHHKNLAKSLNELYTEPAPSISPFDYPSKQVPSVITRSVSTTTDIFNNGELLASHSSETLKSNNGKYLKENIKSITNEMCGITKNILMKQRNGCESQLQKKQQISNEKIYRDICKTVGPRNKPKDIYYIEDTTTGENSEIYIIDPEKHKIKKNALFSSNRSLADYQGAPQNLKNSNFNVGSYDDILFDHNYFPKSAFEERNIYHSRTLPRNFLKKSWENVEMYEKRTSASGLFGPLRKDTTIGFERKSFDNLPYSNQHLNSHEILNPPKWPSVIARSPSNYSIKSQNHFLNTGEFYSKEFSKLENLNTNSSSDAGIFDLDRIEEERRKSHANLFELNLDFLNTYDYGKSTAV